MAKQTITEIKKGQTGTGLLIENDGYISLKTKENKPLMEAIELGNETGKRNIPFPFVVSAVFQKFGIENANGRVYPEAILKREVEKYQQAIKERRAYGECYTPDALCLTKNGWKSIVDVKEGDEILTLNTETNEIEIQKVTFKTESEWNGKLINIKGNHINDMVTPNHGFPVYDRNHKFRKFLTAEEILNSNDYSKFYIPKRGIWKGEEKDYIILPGLKREELASNTKKDLLKKYTEDLKIPTNIFCAFMGIYLSEGHCSNMGYKVNITHKKEETCLKIKQLLDDWGIKYSINGKIGEKQTFYFSDARLHKYCNQFGLCYDKYIPQEIKELSSNYLQIFYDWFLLGDGRIRGHKRYFSNDVFSTSKQLVLDLNEIQLKIGASGTFHEEDRCKDRLIEGRLIKAENSHNMFFTYQSTTQGVYLDKRFLKVEEKEYKGKVYCVEVPNHIWYVMQNGKCHWTKNCNHPESSSIDVGRICMNIIELHWEGHTLVGKIELPISDGFRNYGFISSFADMVAQWLISGLKIGVSSRALGSVKQVLNRLEVGEDLELVCWDVVSQPSTPGAWISENPAELQQYVESEKKKGELIKEDKFSEFENWLNG